MTTSQQKFYWREWAACRRALIALGNTAKEADALRHDLHYKALNKSKSSKLLTNVDLDKILATFRSYSRPSDLDTQLDAINQPRKRIIWSISRLGLTDAYLDKISLDQFRIKSWRDLTLQDLTKLRYTATTRSRAKAQNNA